MRTYRIRIYYGQRDFLSAEQPSIPFLLTFNVRSLKGLSLKKKMEITVKWTQDSKCGINRFHSLDLTVIFPIVQPPRSSCYQSKCLGL